MCLHWLRKKTLRLKKHGPRIKLTCDGAYSFGSEFVLKRRRWVSLDCTLCVCKMQVNKNAAVQSNSPKISWRTHLTLSHLEESWGALLGAGRMERSLTIGRHQLSAGRQMHCLYVYLCIFKHVRMCQSVFNISIMCVTRFWQKKTRLTTFSSSEWHLFLLSHYKEKSRINEYAICVPAGHNVSRSVCVWALEASSFYITLVFCRIGSLNICGVTIVLL